MANQKRKRETAKTFSSKNNPDKPKKILFRRVLIILFVIVSFCLIAALSRHNNHKNSIVRLNRDLLGEKIYLENRALTISGSFGDLEEVPVILQASPNYFKKYCPSTDVINLINKNVEWTFKNFTLDNLANVFKNAGLSQTICSILLSHTKATPDNLGVVTTPPDSVIMAFKPENRLKLYGYFENDSNPLYEKPFYFDSDKMDDWFYKCKLNKAIIEKLKKLTYIQDHICYLSDVHLIVPYLKNEDDWIALLEVLYRTTALEVNLKIKEGEDISKIVEYWGNLGRKEEIEKILTPLTKKEGGGKIDIKNLFPTISRQRLNTYVSSAEAGKYTRDCLWTMFNFFNSESDERFDVDANKPLLFPQIAKETFDKSKLNFGDIIILEDKNNNVFHGCIHIAGNIVYTKNGTESYSSNSPFILSDYDKMMKLYNSGQVAVHVHIYNRRQALTNDLKIGK